MKAVFDTNILIDYLNGLPQAAEELTQYSEKMISIVTYIEVLAGVESAMEGAILKTFLANFDIKPLSQGVADKTIELRKKHRRKLPDAIIYATAKVEKSLLVTRNHHDFDPSLADIRLPYQI